jgi:hypothetical protein
MRKLLEALDEIIGQVAASGGGDYQTWHIGLTHDAGTAYAQWNQPPNFHCWEVLPDEARVLESYFVKTRGMRSAGNDGREPSRTVYVCIFSTVRPGNADRSAEGIIYHRGPVSRRSTSDFQGIFCALIPLRHVPTPS